MHYLDYSQLFHLCDTVSQILGSTGQTALAWQQQQQQQTANSKKSSHNMGWFWSPVDTFIQCKLRIDCITLRGSGQVVFTTTEGQYTITGWDEPSELSATGLDNEVCVWQQIVVTGDCSFSTSTCECWGFRTCCRLLDCLHNNPNSIINLGFFWKTCHNVAIHIVQTMWRYSKCRLPTSS